MCTKRVVTSIALATVLGAIVGAGALSAAYPRAADDRVVYINGASTRAAFVKGQPLVETAAYKVHASRREAPGMAEIHTLDTDIVYVLEGTATFVTGGTAVDPKTIAPNEIRGSAIDGGESRKLVKGDVIVVPHGVPHWFKEVSSPFNYYVVKVR